MMVETNYSLFAAADQPEDTCTAPYLHQHVHHEDTRCLRCVFPGHSPRPVSLLPLCSAVSSLYWSPLLKITDVQA